METRATYQANHSQQENIRYACLIPFGKDWIAPYGSEVQAALNMAKWSSADYSRKVGITSRVIRRWLNDERQISYAYWAILCAEAGLGAIWK